jgi:hypothetical protein
VNLCDRYPNLLDSLVDHIAHLCISRNKLLGIINQYTIGDKFVCSNISSEAGTNQSQKSSRNDAMIYKID